MAADKSKTKTAKNLVKKSVTKTAQRGKRELSDGKKLLSERMKRALARAQLTQWEVAEKAGVSTDAVHKAVQRGSVPRDAKVRQAIADVLDVDASWLWFAAPAGDDPFHNPSQPRPIVLGVDPRIPTGGLPGMVAPFLPDPKGYCLIVDHDGFRPYAQKGDVLYITPSYEPRPGDRVLIAAGNEQRLCEFSGDEDNNIICTTPAGRLEFPRKRVTKFERIAGVIYNR